MGLKLTTQRLGVTGSNDWASQVPEINQILTQLYRSNFYNFKEQYKVINMAYQEAKYLTSLRSKKVQLSKEDQYIVSGKLQKEIFHATQNRLLEDNLEGC